MIPAPLIILSPPRSFSSVVSTMIGQHPDLYCFPELHVFVTNSVGEFLDREAKKGNYSGSPGLLRTLAQLHEGRQTTSSIFRAGLWLHARRDWTVKTLVDDLLARVAPRIGIEKSPVTCMHIDFLHITHACYPRARYLHLTRHPVPTRQSMHEFFSQKKKLVSAQERARTLEFDHLLLWYRMHRNILEFTARLPEGQVLRLKGEDVLSEPDCYLPQLAEWLGVSTDAAAIEEMKHPERSPYARVGPMHARGGNDGKFMRSPRLRAGRVREPSMADFLNASPPEWISASGRDLLAAAGLELIDDGCIASEICALAHRLGYH